MTAQWFVVHVHSGFEQKTADYIMDKAQQKGLESQIADIMVPTEEVVEVRRGQKVKAERKFFPGYMLVKMEMNDAVWHLVQSAPKVTGFLGGKTRPSPISEEEATRIVEQMEEGVSRPKHSVEYDIGEEVRVTDGPFASFNGLVEDVDAEKGKLKVSVSIFGRATPVELEFSQVEKS